MEFCVDQASVADLRAKAGRYRVLARGISDAETARRILELTDELEHRAQAGEHAEIIETEQTMTKPTEEQIRQRAHELWEQNHRPDGRDDEFWHQAERELQESDQMEEGQGLRQ
jgi:hypothetical protein